MSEDLERMRRHGDDDHEPDVEAHRNRRRSDDGEKSDDQPDVEAHRNRRRSDDGEKSDDQPDVEAHRHRFH